jgi:serine/threonine-protein kinase
LISGKYRIERQLGAGGMGTVYVAENVDIGRRVAIKILNSAYAHQSDAISRFQREARAAAQIGHPNIVEIYDMGRTEDGVPYMVMELLEGDTLLGLSSRLGRVPPAQAVDVMVQLLSAIGVAHAIGIIHRDLKPENIFLAKKGQRTDFVKVLDFGVAKFHDAISSTSGRLTRDGSLVGTPAYMSPEQARGTKKLDARSDLYAAGVVMYEMLSGRLPHEGDTYNEMIVAIAGTDPPPLSRVAPGVPPGLAKVVARAMSREPDARYQTASQFSDALQPFVEAMEIDVPVVSMGTPSPGVYGPAPTIETPPPRESLATAISDSGVRRRRFGVFAALAAALVALGGAVAWFARTDPPAAAQAAPIVVAAPLPATAAMPPRGVVSLDVESNAPAAKVFLDGVEIGTAPMHRVVPEAEGLHLLRVEAEGFVASERQVPLSGPVRLQVELGQPAGDEPVEQPTKRIRRGPGKGPGLPYDQDVY